MMKLLRLIFLVIAIYLAAIAILGLIYRVVPPVSTLMLARWITLRPVDYHSVTTDDVSPHLLRAIIRAEDSRFCDHSGVDWPSLRKAVEAAGNGKPARGASTISMQVAKNLFLPPHRLYARKALEIPVALYLDFIWPKTRMIEVYLSVAEWGHGIFGAQAAAQHYFGKNARDLTKWEASLLAAALPSPLKRNPSQPSEYHRNYARRIQGSSHIDISCIDAR